MGAGRLRKGPGAGAAVGFPEPLGGSRIPPGKSTGSGRKSAPAFPAFVKPGWIMRGLIKLQGRHRLTISEALVWNAEI